MSNDTNYELTTEKDLQEVPAPDLPYRPPLPKTYRPKIGLIGCGGITTHHLDAYKQDGLDVIALCDLNEEVVKERHKIITPKRNFIAIITTC